MTSKILFILTSKCTIGQVLCIIVGQVTLYYFDSIFQTSYRLLLVEAERVGCLRGG